MRKVIWCGAALVVCGTAAVFLAARYAAENPDSFLGRCAVVAGDMAVRCNPLIAYRQLRQAQAVPPEKPATIPGPAPLWHEDHGAPIVVGELPEVAEPIVIDTPVHEDMLPQQTGEPDTFRAEEESEVDLPVPIARPEDDEQDNPPYMPYAEEDEEDADEAQASQACGCMARFLTSLLGCDECAAGGSCPCKEMCRTVAELIEELSTEEAEDGTEAQPYSLPVSEPTPAEETTPATDEAADADADAEDEDMGTVRDRDGNLQEDPYYHHHYPSCPYTGGCPYTGRCPDPYHYNLPIIHDETPRETTPPSKPAESSSEKPVNLYYFMHGVETVSHTDVDTMECRPTDLPRSDEHGPF